MAMSLLSRTYRVDYGAKTPTNYRTEGPPPVPGTAIATPLGRMVVTSIPKAASFGRTGVLAARRVL